MSIAELQNALSKPPKYGARRVTIDGISFDSQREATRWQTLRLLEHAGAIVNLQRQVSFPLVVNSVKIGTYRADFVYDENEHRVVEDVKSEPTAKLPAYRLKKQLMKALYGITIREVFDV